MSGHSPKHQVAAASTLRADAGEDDQGDPDDLHSAWDLVQHDGADHDGEAWFERREGAERGRGQPSQREHLQDPRWSRSTWLPYSEVQ